MARLIRRHSMERLELYDLDKINSLSPTHSSNLTLPKKTEYRRSSMNPSVERYQFLCNMSRYRTDPIYAATPMFTTIPYSIRDKSQRQLLGAYIREENVKVLHPSDENQCIQKQDVKDADDEDDENEENVNDEEENATDSDDENQFSHSDSGSRSGSEEDDDENLEDEKGIVEQIINRDKNN